MRKQAFQHAEIRDENDNIISNGAYGKNTALSNAQNDGWVDYVMNNLEWLKESIGDNTTSDNSINQKLAEYAKIIDVDNKLTAYAKTADLSTYAKKESLVGLASTEYVDGRIQHVVGTAPEALDTLGEIATALTANKDKIGTIITEISTKADKGTVENALMGKANAADVYTKSESDGRYQPKGDYVTTGVANEIYLGKNALEEIKNRLDTIENIARTPTGSLVTYEQKSGLLGTIPERIQVIKVSCIESPKDFVFCGMRTSDRELSFYLDQTGSGVCLKLSNKNGQIETVTVAINIMPHFKIEWSYEINKQTPDKFFN